MCPPSGGTVTMCPVRAQRTLARHHRFPQRLRQAHLATTVTFGPRSLSAMPLAPRRLFVKALPSMTSARMASSMCRSRRSGRRSSHAKTDNSTQIVGGR